MRIPRPSPSMVVSLIALVMATTGSAVAAVSFARNSGAVDGKSAVSSRATLGQAAGRLVATERTGPSKGRLPGKFLSGVVRSDGATFGRATDVTDGAAGAALQIVAIPDFGTLTASCSDQDKRAGIEDPITTISFNNTTGAAYNVARRVGAGAASVGLVAAGTVSAATIGGSDTFTFHLERGGVNLLIDGAVRQDGRGTPGASCLVFGTALRVG